MKFRLRTIMLLIAAIALILPSVVFLVRINRQPEMCISRTNELVDYSLPHINCLTVHEAVWGRPRIVILHRITETEHLNGNKFPSWYVDNGYLPVRINGKQVFARELIVVVHAENDSPPEFTMVEPDQMPLADPWWPDETVLWQMVDTSPD